MKKIIPCVIVFIAVVRGRVSVVEHRNSIFFQPDATLLGF